MENKKILFKLEKLIKLLKEYENLYLKSVDQVDPKFPVKNHAKLNNLENQISVFVTFLKPIILKHSNSIKKKYLYGHNPDLYREVIDYNEFDRKINYIEITLQDLEEIRSIVKQQIGDIREIKTPEERDCWYENEQLRFRLADGGTDQFDFSKAKIARKLFEAFWFLWMGDRKEEYSREQIIKKYKELHNEDLKISKIGEIVSNIRQPIINPKKLIKDRIELKFNKQRGLWIFKIFPLSS